MCCGLKLDPKYVDVVVLRWQQQSGKKATLDGDFRSFEEIAQGAPPSDCVTDLERCEHEIGEIEGLLRGGHPDVQGLVLALVDWSAERRLLIEEGQQEQQDSE